MAKRNAASHMKNMKHAFAAAILASVFGLAPGFAFAQQFPWEPVSPPVYSPPAKTYQPPPPKVEKPTHLVPGHKSTYGYVAPYESDGPVSPPLAPGEKSRGWVPGYHDSKGAWIPGHPQ
ncbi:MAG: hypothetical protein K8R18_05035 [Parvibaculum sp.]|uniref:hypothetical protein n=1 Tax=Parvibaculum sp. TaxID=2024848 RepID=UPI0025FD56D7|nr:hypothetical protein [Parvibaculum sp.]MCE9648975.1 hypothetical protein [Parvibaculum sp.]